MKTSFPNTTTRARSEAQAIRTAAIGYDRAVHTHGEFSPQAYTARIAFDRALVAGGFDDPCSDIENSEHELEALARDFHSAEALAPVRVTEGMAHG